VGKASAAEAAKLLGAKLLSLEDALAAAKKERDTTAQLAVDLRKQLLTGEATKVSAR
jgi:hypothetical protein